MAGSQAAQSLGGGCAPPPGPLYCLQDQLDPRGGWSSRVGAISRDLQPLVSFRMKAAIYLSLGNRIMATGGL